MRGRLLNLLTALSLLLCVAACVLWVRSHGREGRWAIDLFGDSYLVLSTRGRVVVCTPPRGPAYAEWPEAAARLAADGVTWVRVEQGPSDRLMPALRPGSETAAVESRDPGPRALLRALDDPDRFAAAHVVLAFQSDGRFPYTSEPPDAFGNAEFDGLRLRLPPAASVARTDRGTVETTYAGPWHADPAQRRALKAMWVERLSQPWFSVPYPSTLLATLVLPAMWLVATLARIHKTQQQAAGLCPSCRYDVRATPGRCPECGTTQAAAQSGGRENPVGNWRKN